MVNISVHGVEKGCLDVQCCDYLPTTAKWSFQLSTKKKKIDLRVTSYYADELGSEASSVSRSD